MNIENPFIKPEEKNFYAETTRIWKKRIAPKGQIFFVVKYKDKKGNYSIHLLVRTEKLTDELKEQIFNRLFEKLKKDCNL